MGDMEIVRQFNSELSTIYETKPPISKAKVASVTRLAVKAIKYYKHVVQSIEKFAQKCRQEYKIPALYVMDSVIRQSRHQFGSEKDVYGPRFAKNIKPTFQSIFKCPTEEQGKVIKVLNLWQKNGIYPPEVIQPLLSLPSTLEEEGEMPSAVEIFKEPSVEMPESQAVLSSSNPLTTVLEEQQQEHLKQIQLLQQKLQEQQRINEQQQQQLMQQQLMPSGVPLMQPGGPGMPQALSSVQQALPEPQPGYEASRQSQLAAEGALPATAEPQGSGLPPPVMEQQQPKFQLQPEVYAQIQALTGMNIRMPQANQSAAVPDTSLVSSQSNIPDDNGSEPSLSNQMPGFPNNANFGPPPGMPVWAPHGMGPAGVPAQQGPLQEEEKRSSLIDDFDYGDDDDDASRIAEQRRHLLEEERRLSQEVLPHMGDMQGEFQNTFRPVGEQSDRHPDPAGSFGRRSPDLHPRDRSPGGHYHKSRSPRRRSRSPRWRDRSPRRRSRSPYGRERDRDRDRDRGRNREREREWHKDRDLDRDRERERGRGSDREAEKRSDWIPVPRKETLSVCSTTIWVGHMGKTVLKENLQEMFEAHRLPVSSIDMVPPRGCAYVVMGHRQDASRGLVSLKNARIHSNLVKLAWAPGKGVKGREYKEYFDTEQGVAFIPWSKLGTNVDFQALSEGGWIDPETMPPGQQTSLKEGSETGSTDASNNKDDKDLGNMSHEELMKLAAAQAASEEKGTEQAPTVNPLTQPPPHIPPPGPHMFPGHHPMIPPPMMMQPPFAGTPLPPNMVPPGAPPPNLSGVPPPNMGGPPLHQFNPPGPPPVNAPKRPLGPPPNLVRPQESGQFPPENNRFPRPGLPQDAVQFPPQFPGRPQDNAQFPGRPQDNAQFPGRPQDNAQFPGRPQDNAQFSGRPQDNAQFPGRPQDNAQFPGRPQDSTQFPGRPQDNAQFPGRPQDNAQFPGRPQDNAQFPGRPQDNAQFPGRPQDNAQFPPQDGKFPPQHPARPEDGGQFPPVHHTSDDSKFPPHHPGRPQEANQFPPNHLGRPQEGGQFPPHHPGRPQDGGPFPPHRLGRFPDGHFPPVHHGPPPFHQRPPHHMRMPPFHPGGPRFPHDLPPLMPSGGPPRGPDFGPPGPGPWGPGPGPMRGPPPHAIPPPGWAENRPTEDTRDPEVAEEWKEQKSNNEEEQAEEMNTVNDNIAMEKPDDERDFGRRPRREHDDRDRDRSRDRSRERGRDRDDRGRDRDDRVRNRDRDERFRDRDRGRDRERDRDRDRGRDRDRDRDDRRRDRDEYRSNKDVNGERDDPRDGPRDGPRRRSRFEPLEEKPDSTELGVKENNVHEIKEPSSNVSIPIRRNSDNEFAPSEEGEIVDGNDNEALNNPKNIETVNVLQGNEDGNNPKDIEVEKFSMDSEDKNIPMDIEAVNNPSDVENLYIPRDVEAVINPTASIPKGMECVAFPKGGETANIAGDGEQSSVVETSKLLNPDIKVDAEQVSSS